MNEHTLFYFPYASFTNQQLPLLKVAALYFDKLIILDPVGASWDTVGADYVARDAVRLLKDAGILELVTPSEVLAKYEQPIAEAIRRDMRDREFLELCELHAQASGKQRWTLSLAKVPQDVQTDGKMRHLMGEFARDVAHKTAYAADDYIEHIQAISSLPGNDRPIPHGLVQRAHDYREYAESGQVFGEYREGYDVDVEYRYADFPLALGEAIMLNHALFTGLLHKEATPLTDETFHSRLLDLKMRRAKELPVVRQALEDRARERQIKGDLLAAAVLSDTQIKLPALDPQVPLEEILEYRQDRNHADALGQARQQLGSMARRIVQEPWSQAFQDELEHQTIPDVIVDLNKAQKARDSWLRSKRGKLALGAAGIGLAAVTVVMSLVVAPLSPVALATAGLSLASGVAIPGAEWLLDLRDAKTAVQENGLHYLLQM